MMKLVLIFGFSLILVATEPIITAISDKRLDFGYIPHWDAKKQSLFVTNAGKSFIRFDSVTKQVYEGKFVDANFKVDFFLPTNECENCFVTSGGLNMYIVNWDGFNSNVTFVRKVTTIPGIKNLTYVNTAKTDPRNRLLVATWRYDCCNPHGNSPNGSVFLIEKSNAIEIIDEARYPSGLEWDTVSSQMYYMDICRLNIRAYDWEANDGTVGKPRTIYDFRHDFPVESAKASYLPVGLGINCHGNLMVGLFNASTVAEINPTTGKLVRSIKIPAETVTGAIFGGKRLDTLFVTTSIRKSDFYANKEPDSSNPNSGKIFMIKGLNLKGCAGRSAGNL